MKTWEELSTAERMSPRKRWNALAEELNKTSTSTDSASSGSEASSGSDTSTSTGGASGNEGSDPESGT